MPKHRSLLCLISILIATLIACGPAPDAWTPLFDGETLNGWKANENPETFRVENGAIVANGARSHLFYVGPDANASFKNFELEAEVMTKPGTNSGIYIHTAFQESGWPAKGFEIQVNNSHIGEGNYRERKKTGSLYGVRNQYKTLVKDDEWFTMNIRVEDKRVQVRVNGVLTVDYVEATPPLEQPGDAAGRKLSSGTFALQGHDPHSTAMFRNLRVRRLPDALKTPPEDIPTVDETYRKIVELSRENFPVVDFHTHIKGDLTLDDVLRRTYRDGIYAGIAVNGGKGFPIESDAGIEAFRQQMEGKPAFIAMQAEGREWLSLFTPEAVAKFDYVFTDSMTWTDDSGKRMRLWIPDEVGTISNPQAFMETLVARTVKIVSEEPIDIYVNPTFLPDQLAADYDSLWTPARMDKVIAAAKDHEVAIEINNRYKIPSQAFLQRAKDAGVLFTCGTNNTGREDMGRMDYCLEMIDKLDLKWADFWVPGVYGEKAALRKSWPMR